MSALEQYAYIEAVLSRLIEQIASDTGLSKASLRLVYGQILADGPIQWGFEAGPCRASKRPPIVGVGNSPISAASSFIFEYRDWQKRGK